MATNSSPLSGILSRAPAKGVHPLRFLKRWVCRSVSGPALVRDVLKRIIIVSLAVISLNIISQGEDLDPQAVADWDWGLPAAIRNGLAYCAGNGLSIVDIRDPRNPREVGSFPVEGGIHDLTVSGDYAFFREPLVKALTVVDISDPKNPVRVGSLTSDVFSDVTHDGLLHKSSVSGGRMCLIQNRWDNGESHCTVWVIDVSDPGAPQLGGGFEPAHHARAVVVSGQFAYVAEWRESPEGPSWGLVEVIDLSDAFNPRFVSGYDTIGEAWDIAVVGGYAYVTASSPYPVTRNDDEALLVLDFGSPLNPHQTDSISTAETGWPGGFSISVSGQYALITRGDVSNPGGPGVGIVVDITDPTDLRRVGAFDMSNRGPGVISGGYAYADRRVIVLQPLPKLSIESIGTGRTIHWDRGVLQFSAGVGGPWLDLPTASPFPLSPIGEKGFFRVKVEE